MGAVSPNAIGFFLELHDSLTPDLKKAGQGYKRELRGITATNAAFQRQIHSGLSNIGKAVDEMVGKMALVGKSFASLPNEYEKAVKAIRASVKPIQQPIEFTVKSGKGSKNDAAMQAMAQTFAQVLNTATLRLSPTLPTKSTGNTQFDTNDLRRRSRKTLRPPDFIGGFKVPKFGDGGTLERDPRIPHGARDQQLAAVSPEEMVLPKHEKEHIMQSLDRLIELIKLTSTKAAGDQARMRKITSVLQDNPDVVRSFSNWAKSTDVVNTEDVGGLSGRESKQLIRSMIETQKALAVQLGRMPSDVQEDLLPTMQKINEENKKAIGHIKEARRAGGGRGDVRWPRPGGPGYGPDDGDPFKRVSRGRNRSGYWPWDPTKRIAMMMYLENTMGGIRAAGGSGVDSAEGFAEAYAQQFGRTPQSGRGLALSHLARAKLHGAPLRADQVVGGLDAATRLGLSGRDLGREFTTVLMNAQAGGADAGQLADMYARMIKRGGMTRFQSAQTIDVMRRGAQQSGLRTGVLAESSGQYLSSAMLTASAMNMRGNRAAAYTQGAMGVHRAITKALGGDSQGASMAGSVTDLIAQAPMDPMVQGRLTVLGVNRSAIEHLTSTGDPSQVLSGLREGVKKYRGQHPMALARIADHVGVDRQTFMQLVYSDDTFDGKKAAAPQSLHRLEAMAGAMAGQVSPIARELTSVHDFLGQGLNYGTGGAFSGEMLGGVNALGSMADVSSMIVNALLVERLSGAAGKGAGRGFLSNSYRRAHVAGRRAWRGGVGAARGGLAGLSALSGRAFRPFGAATSGRWYNRPVGGFGRGIAGGARVIGSGIGRGIATGARAFGGAFARNMPWAMRAGGFLGRMGGGLGRLGGAAFRGIGGLGGAAFRGIGGLGGALSGLGAAYTGYQAFDRFRGKSDSPWNMDGEDSLTKGTYNTSYGLSGGLAFLGPAGIAAALAAQGIDMASTNALETYGSSTEGDKYKVLQNVLSGKSGRNNWFGHAFNQALSLGEGPSRDQLSGMNAVNLESALRRIGDDAGKGYDQKFYKAADAIRDMELQAKSGGLDRSAQDELTKDIVEKVTAGASMTDADFEEMGDIKDPLEKSVKWQERTYRLLSKHLERRGGTLVAP